MADVIIVEPNDDLASVANKLEASQGDQLVLLVPKGTEFLQDPVHWTLVQRQARSLGRAVVVVTQDPDVRRSARGVGFSVFRTMRRLKFDPKSNQATNLSPFLRRGRRSSLPVALGSIILGGALFLALGAFLLVPTGSVTLRPEAQELAVTVSIKASQQAREADPVTGLIPAHLLQAPIDGIETVQTTGHKTTPSTARGEVTFVNRTQFRQTIPASTVLLASNAVSTGAGVSANQALQFVTTQQVELAPSGGTGRAPVVALLPGPSGNIASMAIDRIVDSGLGSLVAVWNDLPTNGGMEDETAVVTAQDQSNLRNSLKGKLIKDGQDRLQALKADGESIYPSTITFSQLDEVFDKGVGAEASNITLRISGSIKGLAFNGKDVNAVAQRAMASQIAKGFQLQPQTLAVSPLEAYDWGEDWVAFRIMAKAKASTAIDTSAISNDLMGKTQAAARAYLESRFPEREQLNIQVRPIPMDWLPVYVWKIDVRY